MDYKTIMVHLELRQPNEGLLAIAADLAARLDAGVIGIAGCQPIPLLYEQQAYISPEVLDADRKQIEEEMRRAKARFQEAMKPVSAMVEWRSVITPGSLADYIADEMRAADLLITGPDIGGSMFDRTREVRIADLVFRAGRPTLIVPKEHNHINLSEVVIGWKETPECRRAISDALPILKLAGRVTVLAIASKGDLATAEQNTGDVVRWLNRHRITARAKTWISQGDDASRFAELVKITGAGLVVAGAYGHSRFHEWALGGVTGDYLIDPDRPVLLSH